MSSALPKPVQAQIDRANKIAEELRQAKNPPAPPAEPVVTVVPVDPPADVAPEPAPPAPAPAPAPAPEDDKDTWQHKYRVLQGKYNAEVPRLTREVSEQSSLMKELRQQLNNTQSLLASLHHRSQAPAQPAVPLVNEEEIEQFGPDLYDFIKRTARGEVAPLVESAAKPVAERVSKIEKTTSQQQENLARSNRSEVLRYLAEHVPSWDELNVKPEFLSWLDEIDPYSGSKRGTLLTKAFEGNDAARVVAFFKGYLNENAAVSAGTSTPTPAVTSSAPAEPQTKMENLVAPGAPNAPTASAPNEAGKRVWSQADVAELYRNKNEFIKRGKKVPDELEKLERDLFRAQKEGRIHRT